MGWFGGYVLQTNDSVPGNYEVVTVGDTPTYFSRGKVNPSSGPYAGMTAQAVLISLEGGTIRFRLDTPVNGPPTSTVGHILTDGDALLILGLQAISQFRAIRLEATETKLQVTYFY
ncbi:MAG: hypothetical protein JRI59_02590 [Deltaproteobacteria bacterium]|nr:hypothetical protein [Deltaproteobacteria bacterium]